MAITAPMLGTCPECLTRLEPGRVLVGWSPCQCSSALRARHGRGHRTTQCRTCMDVHQTTTVRYEPYHVLGGDTGR
jgi:hypothetical protein